MSYVYISTVIHGENKKRKIPRKKWINWLDYLVKNNIQTEYGLSHFRNLNRTKFDIHPNYFKYFLHDLEPAVAGGYLDIVKYLVSIGCDPKACNNRAIRSAAKYDHLEIVKYLASEEVGCDPKVYDNQAIRFASRNGNLELVKYLVGIGCDPKASDNYAIRWACYYGYLEVVKYLVLIGCEPKAEDNCAIQWASGNGHLKVLKYLIEIGCDHSKIKKDIKFEVLQEIKGKLLFFLNGRLQKQNLYLKSEILQEYFPTFTFVEIFKILNL